MKASSTHLCRSTKQLYHCTPERPRLLEVLGLLDLLDGVEEHLGEVDEGGGHVEP